MSIGYICWTEQRTATEHAHKENHTHVESETMCRRTEAHKGAVTASSRDVYLRKVSHGKHLRVLIKSHWKQPIKTL